MRHPVPNKALGWPKLRGLQPISRLILRSPAVLSSFIGRPALFPSGLAALHTATRAPVWFAVLLLEDQLDSQPGGLRLRLHLSRLVTRCARPPIAQGEGSTREGGVACATGSEDALGLDNPADEACALKLVHAYADALSSAVREAPAQYFWWHRRWRGEVSEFQLAADTRESGS